VIPARQEDDGQRPALDQNPIRKIITAKRVEGVVEVIRASA
jgi:hypothetical protein